MFDFPASTGRCTTSESLVNLSSADKEVDSFLLRVRDGDAEGFWFLLLEDDEGVSLEPFAGLDNGEDRDDEDDEDGFADITEVEPRAYSGSFTRVDGNVKEKFLTMCGFSSTGGT